MAISVMNKGFMLIDSLICIVISISICLLVQMIFNSITAYEDGYERYLYRMNENLESIFESLETCEGCKLDESD